MRVLIAAAAAALVCTSVAAAKEFHPGDLRVCGATKCVAITNRAALRSFSSFIYMGPQPATSPSPSLGAPTFELRFRNGYVAGIVASARLDRFLSYGVYLGRFVRGTWYAMPARASAELRRLTRSLAPFSLTQASLDKSR